MRHAWAEIGVAKSKLRQRDDRKRFGSEWLGEAWAWIAWRGYDSRRIRHGRLVTAKAWNCDGLNGTAAAMHGVDKISHGNAVNGQDALWKRNAS